jgi:hypothetical protein
MLSFKDKGYEAPFKVDSLQARRAMRGLQEIYKTEGKVQTSRFNDTITSGTLDGHGASTKTYDPIYFDELALSRFVEEFLDSMIPEIYKHHEL